MRAHGRPVLGGVMGFLFGVFVGLDLLMFSVVALRSALLTILPIVGLILGAVWGRLGLVGRASGLRTPALASSGPEPSASPSSPSPSSPEEPLPPPFSPPSSTTLP